MNLRLTSNHLLVEPVPRDKLGSIHLPDQLKDDHNIGGPKEYWVHLVGPGRLTRKGVRIPVEAQPGDRVVCLSYTEGPKPFDGKAFIITEDQVLLILPKIPVPTGNGFQ